MIYVNPRPEGPFGPYWPAEIEATTPAALQGTADENEDQSEIAGPLSVYLDADEFSAEERGEILSLMSELYSLRDGDRLVIDEQGISEVPVLVPVGPQGGGTDD